MPQIKGEDNNFFMSQIKGEIMDLFIATKIKVRQWICLLPQIKGEIMNRVRKQSKGQAPKISCYKLSFTLKESKRKAVIDTTKHKVVYLNRPALPAKRPLSDSESCKATLLCN